MTYVPDQQVFGWHMHETTGGAFESACIVSEGNEDVLYVVARAHPSTTRRSLRRASQRGSSPRSGCVFCGLWTDVLRRANGHGRQPVAPGRAEVQIWLTARLPPATVTDGAIVCRLQGERDSSGCRSSRPAHAAAALEGMNAAGQGTLKNVTKAHLRVSSSSLVQAGPSFGRLRAYPFARSEQQLDHRRGYVTVS